MKKISIILLSFLTITACQNPKKEEIKKDDSQSLSPETTLDTTYFKTKGKEIAQATFKAFVEHIKAKSQEGGLPAVLNFCHDNALKLTDSMSSVYHVKIKRTSHKLRNPYNAPDENEKKVLNAYLSLMEKSEKPQAVVKKDEKGNVHFYAPIFIKQDCMKCHGEPGKDIPEKVYKMIKEKYPEDQATGFKVGDLRGIWDIEFSQKK